MLLYLSDAQINQRLTEANDGIRPDELTIRKESLLKEFFGYVARSFNFNFAGLVEAKGNFALVRATLGTSDRQKIINALAFIQPLALKVEETDLAALIPNRLIQSAARANWKTLAPDFDRISADDLLTKIEAAAVKVSTRGTFNGAGNAISFTPAQEDALEREALKHFKDAGIKDPLEDWNRRDKNRAAEEERLQSATDWLNKGYEEPSTPENPKCSHGMNLSDCLICWGS